MTISKNKIAVLCLMILAVFATKFCVTQAVFTAFAETDNKTYVEFYIDDDTIYQKVEVSNSKFTVPEVDPTLENFEFVGWTDGFVYFEKGKEYTIYSSDIKLYATWEEIPEVPVKEPTPVWKIVLYTLGACVLLGTFLFFYYWCGIRETRVKNIIPTIKKERAEKKAKKLNKAK